MRLNRPASSFNEIHTAFVTTDSGTSLAELVQVLGALSIIPLIIPLVIPWILPPSFVKLATSNKEFLFLVKVIVEYPLLTVLPVWTVTIFTGAEKTDNLVTCSSALCLTLICLVLGLLIVNHAITSPKWSGLYNEWNKLKETPLNWGTSRAHSPSSKKLPFITNYRAIVISTTILCIIAVDFPIFPRRFAKTHTYGISLMDVGTGCFVFANGIVAPEARNKVSPIISSLKSTVPIVVLGFIRLISVKGIEYQEVVEEYGVHWNFFFTLAAVKVLSSFLFWAFNSSNGLVYGVAISLLYEFFLNNHDFQNEYILNPKVSRQNSLVSANREGIFSVFGYLSIYLISVYIGKIIMVRKRATAREWLQYSCQALIQNVMLWTLYFVSVSWGNPPCRRTANLSYVLLMVGLNYSLLWIQLFIALTLIVVRQCGLLYGPMVFYELTAFHAKQVERMAQISKDFETVLEKSHKEAKLKEVDERVVALDRQLEEALVKVKLCKRGTPSERKLRDEITHIENEITELEELMKEDTSQESKEKNVEDSSRKVCLPDLCNPPVILESICYNGLAVFLMGNLLTGLINCMIYTMYASSIMAMCCLWAYMTVICASSVTLYWLNVQLKFW